MPNLSEESARKKATPLNCLVGSAISGSLGYALYSLTASIIHTFAAKPLTSSNPLVVRIGSLVRTLVMGVASLGTFIFFFVAFGLILLAIQLLLQKDESSSPPKNS
ncbi:DUF3082 domain-containing protein [Crocosphaera sp. XPORK-15E]|uniref:DUF3082 domain-containing protein n=1 Tax=Crocosphaera sp. XPORK-15E TaxID=3110247 RepID=UPI002B1EE6E9|nr:DUF3082 domain-containing protein [Crocosphaera sp. XPORK-15E]MEA5534044.1 DUF3082 domain-containing protein [Crocosphaera sp. XPORK-15E]